ncbi:hypothetical protein B0H16DRAFT_1610248, partial [Mycena metata]
MARRPTAAEVRINNITACLTPQAVLALLNDLNDVFEPPFIKPIFRTTQALLSGLQNVKTKKNQCFRLVERIHQVLYTIIYLHLRSETVGSLSPATLEDVSTFAVTLQKIYTFIEIQQHGNKIKQFFRQGKVDGLLRDCFAGLDHTLEVFKVGFIIFEN